MVAQCANGESLKMISELKKLPRTENRMPVLFIGHGNPMYGIEENDFTRGWKKSIENVPKPKAILVVSAHWETRGTRVTSNENPRVIYDFGKRKIQRFDFGGRTRQTNQI